MANDSNLGANLTASHPKLVVKNPLEQAPKLNKPAPQTLDDSKSSRMETTQIKQKLIHTVMKQQKKYISRESMMIAAIHVIIWSLGYIIRFIMYNNFFVEMTEIIELRKGFMQFSIANSAIWTSSITLFHEMLVRSGKLDYKAYLDVMPSYPIDYNSEFDRNYNIAQDYSF